MKAFLVATIVLVTASARAEAGGAAADLFERPGEPKPRCSIDEAVFGRLETLGIRPARVCSDAVFVRRVYLDVIGTLPTAAEARQFLRETDPNKRRVLIDRLLERKEFAD